MRNITTKTGIVRSLKRFYANIQNKYEQTQPEVEPIQVFDTIPTTFVVNTQFRTTDCYRFIKRYSDLATNEGMSLKERMPAKHCKKNMWLLKPAALNQGRGIQIFSRMKDIFDHIEGNSSANTYWVIQKYIERPLLFQNRKFDIRIWVLITMNGQNQNEINLYMYKEGYLRTSSSTYDLQDENKYVHLTNNCLQQKGDAYGQHEQGNTLSFQVFQQYLDQNFKNPRLSVEKDFIPRMKDLIIDTISSIKDELNPQKRKNQFELLGYDFLIDEDFRVWLLEVNNNPYLGVPNDFIRGLLPQMIRDMFKIVIPGSSFKDNSQRNDFELILSDSQNINVRRTYSIDLLYPHDKLKQLVGKEKKTQILQQKKDRFKAIQANYERNQKSTVNINPQLLEFQSKGQQIASSLNPSNKVSQADLKLKDQQSQQEIARPSRLTQKSRMSSVAKTIKLGPVDEYKEIHKISLQNQFLLSRLTGKTPSIAVKNETPKLNKTQEDNLSASAKVIIIDQSRTNLFKQSHFKKDILKETQDICFNKTALMTQSQFDYLFNKILSKIQQWELFDDNQINKTIQSFEVLCSSKASIFFHSQTVVDKILTIVENDSIPFRFRIKIFENFDSLVRVLSQSMLFIDNKNLISILRQLIDTWVKNQEDQQAQRLKDISFKILVMMLQIESSLNKSYIPKITKEKEALKQKAIENEVLSYLLQLYTQQILDQEIKTQVLSKITLKDLQIQLQLLISQPPQIQQSQVINFLQNHISRIQQEQSILLQKELETKQKQQEQHLQFMQQQQEQRESKRKFAEEMFFKRLEEKRRQKTDALKKQMMVQEQIERELEEQRQAKIEKIKKRQEQQRRIKEEQNKSSRNIEIIDEMKQQMETDKKAKVRSRMAKLSNSQKKQRSQVNELVDNIVVFSQKKKKRVEKEGSYNNEQINVNSTFDSRENDVEIINQNVLDKIQFRDSQSILQNLKAIKNKHQNKTNLSNYLANDYIAQTLSSLRNAEKQNQVIRFKDRISSGSVINSNEVSHISNTKPFKKKQMILPSLDYDIGINNLTSKRNNNQLMFATPNQLIISPMKKPPTTTSVLQQKKDQNREKRKLLQKQHKYSQVYDLQDQNVLDPLEDQLKPYFKRRANSKVQTVMLLQDSPMSQAVNNRNGSDNKRRLSPIESFRNRQVSTNYTIESQTKIGKKKQEMDEIVLLMLKKNKNMNL